MGKGLVPADHPKALGSVGLQSGDYSMAGFDEADVVLAIGYDLVEHSPEHWNPGRDKRIVCIDSTAGRDRRVLHPRRRAGRRHLPRAHPAGRGVPPRAPPGRVDPPARGGARPLRGREGRRRLPGPAAARAVRDPPGARPRGHPDLRRRPAQAVDRAHVPGLRAEHGADRQRPGRHGLRGARGGRGQARAPRPQGRDRERRRRLPHELPGAGDRRAPEDPVRERDLGEQPVRLDRVEAGQEVRPATSAWTSRTPTS